MTVAATDKNTKNQQLLPAYNRKGIWWSKSNLFDLYKHVVVKPRLAAHSLHSSGMGERTGRAKVR